MTQLLRSDVPVSYTGRHYRLQEAILLPRPGRKGRPPLLIGGSGAIRTLPLAARYADKWNAVFVPPAKFAELNRRLDTLLAKRGRRPVDVHRSLMTGLVFGRDDAEVERNLRGRSPDALRARGVIIGQAADVQRQLKEFAEAGVQRIMLQWLDLDNLDALEALARAVLPRA